METLFVLIAGLLMRLTVLVFLFLMLAAPIVAVLYATQGVRLARRRMAGTVDAGGARWKPGLTYLPGHTWTKSIWKGVTKVGLDDVARRVMTGVSSITLVPVGTRLRRGDAFAEMKVGKRFVTIPSPVAGIVLERNRTLIHAPEFFELEPYGRGWMLRVETDGPPGPGMRGAGSKRWLRDESLRLTRFFESELGIAAADGGTLPAPPPELLSEAAWRRAVQTFLRREDPDLAGSSRISVGSPGTELEFAL